MKIKKAESQMYAERGIISEQKNKLGITLIALVVTIVVLLVLAGVVINFTMRRKWLNRKGSGLQ